MTRSAAGERPTEIELKLETDANAAASLRQSAMLTGSAGSEREQFTTYFDTPDADLRAAGVSLRVRRIGERHIQTIKAGGPATAGIFARPEWEREIAGPGPDMDDLAPLHGVVGDSAPVRLRPVFTIAVRRHSWEIERSGTAIELVADEGTVSVEDRHAAVAEIEAELMSGDPAALFALARDLGREVPLRLGVLTKAERGYRLAENLLHRPAKAERVELDEGANVAQAFAAIAGSCLRQFRLNEDALRKNPQPDALHQARVALRRLRSALSIFKPVLADDRFDHFAAELRRLAHALGEARDLDVLVGRLGPNADPAIHTAREQAYAAALATLDTQRTRDLMIDLVAWITVGEWRVRPVDPAVVEQPAEDFAAASLRRLRRRLKKRGQDLDTLDDEQRHRVRILAKKLRYVAEFFESLFTGKKARRRYKAFRKRLAALQEDLGELNDLATAPALLKRFDLDEQACSPDRREALIADAAKAHRSLIKAERFW
ncbi:Inorganic triphosphatase YgiF, contains CYTH and CHAD domains [Sphingomonas sp. OV641]|uniref:CYTH and CHAD domain-containing protein n=1 Tax=Sphingomonas sp. OV641 TaxID=1881068 RepID=UPI0008D2E7DF|nr:CHAD domain-containing protein [Sphingomonas sp. OV641]SEJ56500.1 Inorganic triphosphatase YgiF, contains CYTH and CHAD domains [Sphingomonas sp. OV641]